MPTADDGHEPRRRDRVWLVCEWRDGEDAPKHFHLATYKRMPFVQLIQLLKERWRTERVYQDLKGELGLDHYQGRRFQGWHHHVSVAICCFAFLAAERARAFPPRVRTRRTATRSASRPERHFHDSFITIRLAFARHIARWLARCPLCHYAHAARSPHQAAARVASG